MKDFIAGFVLGIGIVIVLLVAIGTRITGSAETFCEKAGSELDNLRVMASEAISTAPVCRFATDEGVVLFYDDVLYFEEDKQ